MKRGQQKRLRARARWVIVLGLCVLVGVAVIGVERFRVVGYDSVQGTVHAMRIDSQALTRGTVYRPVIKYGYVVGGLSYQNDSFNLHNEAGGEKWAREALRRYHLAGPCTVYYDPSDPQQSVLSRKPSDRTAWLMALFSIVGGLSVARGIMALRHLKMGSELD